MKKLSSLIILSFLSTQLFSQVDSFLLNEKSFLKQANDFAPFVQNSDLNVSIQYQEWMASRSPFQPKLKGNYSAKQFEDKTYYSKFNSDVSVKTPLGIKVGGGFQNNNGVFLNPENNDPVQGLAFAGVEIPLGAGMFTDDERTEVRLQSIKRDAASLLNKLQVNDYLFESGEAYWEWFGSILQLQLAQEAVERAESRLEFVKQMNSIKEVADIDTLEALINLQNREAYAISTQIKWVKNKNYINNYLWIPGKTDRNVAPEADLEYEAVFPDSLLEEKYTENHPLILLIEADSLINRVELNLVREYFKPEIDFEFKLQEAAENVGSFEYNPRINNYVGLDFQMPLFLRKERAKSKQLNYKSEIIQNKKIESLTKIYQEQRTAYLNSQNLLESVNLWQNASENYFRMLEAEITMYNIGESSLFVINNRELRWINAKEKYIKSYIDYRIAVLKYYHSLCILPDMVN